jgi:hypothetical protein
MLALPSQEWSARIIGERVWDMVTEGRGMLMMMLKESFQRS